MMLLIGFVHRVLAYIPSNSGIKDFFFQCGVDLEFQERFGHDLFLSPLPFSVLEIFEKALNLLVIGFEKSNGVSSWHSQIEARFGPSIIHAMTLPAASVV